jgi:ubiquinone/menaquinone biosynthesis C-methylase UbiE
MGLKKSIRSALKKIVNLTGYEIKPINARGLGYISAEQTLKKASEKNLSLLQYLENIWGIETESKKVMAAFELNKYLTTPPFSILEIGAGTGVNTDQAIKILGRANITCHQIYETDLGWSDYLGKTYPVEIVRANGFQLNSTKDNSMDFIHAHGVFVYTSFIITMSYLKEIRRTARLNSIVAFDAFDETCFSTEIIENWIRTEQTYPGIVPEKFIIDTLQNGGFELLKTFYTYSENGRSRYFIFKRNSL